jgi:hypothetical protein
VNTSEQAEKIHYVSQPEHTPLDADYVLTLEEIANLAARWRQAG